MVPPVGEERLAFGTVKDGGAQADIGDAVVLVDDFDLHVLTCTQQLAGGFAVGGAAAVDERDRGVPSPVRWSTCPVSV